MSFLTFLKDKIKYFTNNLQSLYSKFTNYFFENKGLKDIEKNVKIYHNKEFSHAFIFCQNENILNYNQLRSYIEHISNSIDLFLKHDNSVLINIIIKFTFIDDLNIHYVHSLSCKQFFQLENLKELEFFLRENIEELSLNYNDSKIEKIELRFDYIKAKTS